MSQTNFIKLESGGFISEDMDAPNIKAALPFDFPAKKEHVIIASFGHNQNSTLFSNPNRQVRDFVLASLLTWYREKSDEIFDIRESMKQFYDASPERYSYVENQETGELEVREVSPKIQA